MTKIITKDNIREDFPFMKDSPLAFGNGWNSLVYELCTELDNLLDNKPSYREFFLVIDCKEKYGGLNMYVYGADDEILDTIDKYEALSYTVCEHCGKPGELRDWGWMATLCDEHYAEVLSNTRKEI